MREGNAGKLMREQISAGKILINLLVGNEIIGENICGGIFFGNIEVNVANQLCVFLDGLTRSGHISTGGLANQRNWRSAKQRRRSGQRGGRIGRTRGGQAGMGRLPRVGKGSGASGTAQSRGGHQFGFL